MLTRLLSASTLALAVLAAQPAHAVTEPMPPHYPVRDFFAQPDIAYFRLSGDGKTLSYMKPVDNGQGQRRLNIFVQPLVDGRPHGEARQLTHETARDIANYFWKGSDTILYQKDFGGDENYHVVAVDVKTGNVRDLTPGDKLRASVEDDLPDDPAHVLISHNRRNAEVFDVYRYTLATGAETLVAQNPGDYVGWLTDHAGNVRMAVKTTGLDTVILYRPDEKSAFKPIITTDYKTDVNLAFFDADNRHFYAISNRGRDKKALVRIDPAQPDVEHVVFATDAADVSGASWSRAHKRLIAAEYEDARLHRQFFDPAYKAMFAKLEQQLPGMELLLQSASLPETRFIVAAFSDRTPGTRYVYDAPTNKLSKLADINDKLPVAAMAPMKPVTFTARDGLTIHGYLTLPVGRAPKDLACIVNPHGGPWARDSWGFNPEVQFLANRGYCILQINYRGSLGYGRKFWEASFGQWGLAMQDDITDGVKWLVAQGIADPKRIGIYGGSYGGYATLSGITKTPDLYAAAVDYVGVANLLTFLNTIPPYWRPELPKTYEMIGDPVKDKERMMATSPVNNADKIVTPLLIAQGARDPRVNKDESDQMVAALKKRGVDVQYIVKDNEGHGFHNEENQFEFYGAMEAFFAKYLHPDAPLKP
ncbi:MAG: S9 family peptidase [Proteobacteria bacterium]|nr:S9 family peptidase [Pseudomonadota bacterium]